MKDYLDQIIHEQPERTVGPWFALGIFLFPIIFTWWLLREGHSTRARLIGFGWLAFCIFVVAN